MYFGVVHSEEFSFSDLGEAVLRLPVFEELPRPVENGAAGLGFPKVKLPEKRSV